MKSLLIATTYGENAALEWWPIQQYFIKKYTKDYDFAVFLHDIQDKNKFKDCIIIGEASGDLLHVLPDMFEDTYRYFGKHEYQNYLLLDSDCFPIKENWQSKILDLTEDYYYTAPIRTDNLDVSPHPCALFIRGEHINKNLFSFRRPSLEGSVNLLGDKVYDIGTGFKTKIDDKQIFFPLLRSNYTNYHPMLAAIYGDLFYHHGGGSRNIWFRSTSYWNKINPEHYQVGLDCYEQLLMNPHGFIDNLRFGI